MEKMKRISWIKKKKKYANEHDFGEELKKKQYVKRSAR